MPDLATFSLSLSAAVALSLTPGPGTFYVMTRTLKGGQSEGIASALGTAAGTLFHVIAAALGISAILATSAVLFSLVKYLGAAYLIYIGIKTILDRDKSLDSRSVPVSKNYQKAFLQGITVGIFNPKVALFFLAFIPQFVNPHSFIFAQFLLLGTVTVFLNTVAKLAVVFMAQPISQKMRANPRLRSRQRFFTGTGLAALGTYMAVTGESES